MSAPRASAALAERALGHTQGDALVAVRHEHSLTAAFARSTPTLTSASDVRTVSVLRIVDGHPGVATVTDPDDDALRAAAHAAQAAAHAAARHGPGVFPALPAPATPRGHDGFDPATARQTADDAQAVLAAVVAARTADLQFAGTLTTGAVETAVASSAGALVSDRATHAHLEVVAHDPRSGRRGFATATATAAAAIDPSAVAREAATKAVAAGDPADLPPGAYPVVLDAPAVAELLHRLGWLAFDGLAHAEGRGALTGRLGTRVAAPRINLSDSPRFARTLPRSIDAEGVAKAPLPLIQDGVAHRVVHDTRSAALAGGGAVSTGHASRPGGAPGGVAPANLVLVGGDAADVDELAAPIDRGLYVTRVRHVATVQQSTASVAGVTADGTFLIEDGRFTRPLRDVRFSDSILRLLEATEALTARSRLAGTGRAAVVCPALRADGLRVDGRA